MQKVREQLTVNGNDALNLSLLALYLAKLEDRAGADAAAKKALALNPQDAEVLYAAAVVDALAGRVEDVVQEAGRRAGARRQCGDRSPGRRTSSPQGLPGL